MQMRKELGEAIQDLEAALLSMKKARLINSLNLQVSKPGPCSHDRGLHVSHFTGGIHRRLEDNVIHSHRWSHVVKALFTMLLCLYNSNHSCSRRLSHILIILTE